MSGKPLRQASALALLAVLAFPLPALRTTAVSTGNLVSVGTPVAARFSHTATLLANNKVLIAGGMERNGIWLDSAELYDPSSGRFTAAGKMRSRRAGATATLLPNGKVLIAGGNEGPGSSVATAEIYDPATNTFAPAVDMSIPRGHAVGVSLKSGMLLIAGGSSRGDDDQLASAEIYDPAAGKFTATGSMHTARSSFSAVALKDGRVMVMGGYSGGQYPYHKVEATAEVYDPATGSFTLTGRMTTPRYKHGAVLLPDGRVLVVGGSNEDRRKYEYSSTEIFDPKTAKFTAGPEMKFQRFKLPAGVVALRNGRVLVAGGAEQPELYDPATGVFVPLAGSTLDGFLFSTATLLQDGRVLLVDGYGSHPVSGAVRHAWVYTP
jgi:hypothetical protein